MSWSRIILFRTILSSDKYFTTISRRYSQKALNLSDTAVQKYLKNLVLEHDDLHTKSKRNDEESRRLLEIKPIVTVLDERVALFESIENLKELFKKDNKDDEMKKMIKEEAEMYLQRLQSLDDELQAAMLQPYLTEGGVLLEVTAGAGGQEAMLFARELFDMYQSYANYRGWELDIASIEKSDLGGIRKASLLISGPGAPELMRLEAGVHRVQRIPSTEKGGRMHTSTVSIAVLPQPTGYELNLPEKDLSIETKRASGAGGQHVNTTDSAVRIIHIPTGTTVECQEGRSQIKNKEIALQKLRTLLMQKQQEEQVSKMQQERKSQVGTGERNEKIRTYNFPQDRVTEHRPGGGTMHSLKTFIEGSEQLEQLHENLLIHSRHEALLADFEEFKKKHMAESTS